MVKINELNTPKLKKTNNSKLYKNFLKLLMSAGLFITPLAGCAPEEQPIKNSDTSQPSDPVVEKSQIELLAEEYEFLQWYLDDSTSKTVDGVTYDLTSLREQNKDLYRFVEPLSKEEVEYRFQYLAEYFADQAEKGIYEVAPGGIKQFSQEVEAIANKKIKAYFEPMYKKELGEELSKFSKYYEYLEKTGNYYEVPPKSMYELEKIVDLVDKISFEEKEWFVRSYVNRMEIRLNVCKELKIEPQFDITLSSKTK